MKIINPVRNKFLNGVKNNLIFILPILTGILLVLAYPPYDLEFLVWFALVPLFYFLVNKNISSKKAFSGGFLAGIIFLGISFSWVLATYPFEWLGATTQKESILFLLLTIVLVTIQTVFLGAFFGVFSWLVKKISPLNKITFWSFLIIPCLWIIFEYLRAWGFGIVHLGKETLFGPHWTFGNLAYMLHNHRVLIQIADFGGIYLISFLIVLINLLIFFLATEILKPKPSKKSILVSIIFLISIGLIWNGYGFLKLTKNLEESLPQPIKIALLQTNFLSGSDFNPYQKEKVFKAVLDLFQATKEKALPTGRQADIIIFPEGFSIVSFIGDKEISKYLLKNFWQPGQIYLDNAKIIEDNDRIKSRLFYRDLEKEEPLGYHDKILLVPDGDFLPHLTKLFLKIYSFNLNLEKKFYQKGEKNEPVQTPTGKIGSGICNEVISPNLSRELTKNGAEFLVNITSDAPFHGAKSLLDQKLAMAKLRVIENRRYFAQATNMGYSFLLNQKGEIVVKNTEFGNKILFADIYLLNKKTIYTKFGDWIVILAGLIFIGFIIKRFLTFNF